MTDGTAVKLANLIRGNDRGAISLRVLLSAALIAASGGVGFTAFMQPAGAALAPGTICHASNSNTNPYQQNPPSFTAQAGGHDDHKGPIWYHNIPTAWGDIIPPFDYDDGGVIKHYPGLNWGVSGQEIWANDCDAVYPDLAIVKTSSGNGNEGGTGSYFLNVSNVGNGTAFGTAAAPLVVTDTMPTGVVATAASGAGWTCTVAAAGASIRCERPTDLSPGAAAGQITVSVDWTTTGSKSNTGTVATVTGEKVTSNNTSTITTTVAGPLLSGSVVKTSDADGDTNWTSDETTPTAGADVTFRATVTNNSGVTVNLGALSDNYGAAPGTTITPACAAAKPATLAAGASYTCEFTVTGYTAAAGGSVSNTFSATLSRAGSTDVTPTGSAVVRTGPTLSGTIVKTSDADGDTNWTSDETTPTAGADVTFRATVTNNSGVTVNLGALSDNYGAAPGTTITPACAAAKPATLAAGASYTCEFTVTGYTAAAGGSVSNTFSATLSRAGSNSVTPTGQAIVRTGNPLSGTVVKTSDADGDTNWTADETTPTAGADVTFRATVTNNSGVTVNLGALSDNYGAAPGTTITPACAAAKPATLAAGASYTCEFTVTGYTAAAGGSVSNTFSATLSKTGSSSVTPTGSAVVRTGPALTGTVVKTSDADGNGTWTADETAPSPGTATTFRATVTNNSGVTVNLGALSDNYGAAPGTTITPVCAAATPATLAAGASYTCEFTVAAYTAAPGGTVENTFSATLSKAGSNSVTPTGKAVVRTAAVDLAVTKTGPASRLTGQTGDYTLQVQNLGAVAMTDPIVVTDTLPAGVTVAGPVTNGGFTCTVAGNVVTCTTNDDLAVGGSKTITLPASFTTVGNKVNTATVAATGDVNLANNTATAATMVTDPIIPPPPTPLAADLAVKKTGPASVTPGGTATWALTVTNKGPGNASGFSVTDTLPAGVSLLALSGTNFTCTAATLVCTFTGVLLPTQTAVVTVVGDVSNAITGTSIANVVVVGPTDATPADNTDTLVSGIVRPAAPADLVMEKLGPAVVVAGEQVTWTITVTNAGGQDATGFTVGDPLSAGVSLVGGNGNGFFCTTNLPLACVFPGTLAPGETAALEVTGLVDEGYDATSITNTASVPLANDPTPENNSDSATVPVAVPIEGGEEEPATGSPSPSPLPDLPFVPEEEAPAALPFTGSSTDQLLGVGALLSLLGLMLIVTGRRRRTVG